MSVNQTTVCDSCGAEYHSEVPRGGGPMAAALGSVYLESPHGRPVGWARVALNGTRHVDLKKAATKNPMDEAMDEMIKALDSAGKEMPKEARKVFKVLKQAMKRMSVQPAMHEHFDDAWDLCGDCTKKLQEFLKTMDLKQEMLVPRMLQEIMAPGAPGEELPGMGRTLDDLLDGGGGGDADGSGDVGHGG